MLPLHTIVCPTDFSRRSLDALETAEELARTFDSQLIVLHVLTAVPVLLSPPGSPVAFDVPAYQEELERATTKRLHEVIAERISDTVTATGMIRWGDPAHEIADLARTEGADLIVIATRGESGLSRLVTGSVTEKVVRLAEVPVLSVQPAEEDDNE
jgi:nucleotide-binding universal stress UspA family protein